MNPLLCQKALAWSRELYAPERLLHPLRRVGERGEGRWERISWDEALTETADAILDAIEEVGSRSILMELSPQVAASLPASRFMGALGGTSLDVNATINDFVTGLQLTFGKFSFSQSFDDNFHSELTLHWHSNPAYTWIPSYHFWTEGRYRGAEQVLISTDVSPSHVHMDYHVPVRHGTDAALALAMCQVVISEGLVDWGFAASQTDLSLLVRTDTGEFLRQSHLEADGRDDRFFHAHPERGVVPADPASLHLDFEPLAEGELEVETLDAGRVTVEPVFARLRRRLDRDYTPEQASEICEAHPDVIRMLARKVASKRTRLSMGMGAAKYYHGDLISRSALLLLALTGNWGKKGAGTGSWNSFTFDGTSTVMAKTKPGVEGGMEVVELARTMREQMIQQDPTLTGELADRVLWRMMGGSVMVPPVFFWYHQAGFRERWNRREWGDPTMKRSFDEYFEEASQQETWKAAAEAAATKPARVLLEIGGNTLRRTRGGKKAVFENLWPKLEKVVCMDYRMSETALHADIVLPAAQHYEKAGFPHRGALHHDPVGGSGRDPTLRRGPLRVGDAGRPVQEDRRAGERARTGELHAQRRASAPLRRAMGHIHAGAERWSTGRAMWRRRWPTRWHRETCRPAPRSTPSARRATAATTTGPSTRWDRPTPLPSPETRPTRRCATTSSWVTPTRRSRAARSS